MKTTNNNIDKLLTKLYQEVTPEGKILLFQLIDEIVLELESVRQNLRKAVKEAPKT